MSLIKSPSDLASVRKAGEKLARVLSLAKKEATIGMTTKELDVIITKAIKEEQSTPSFLNYEGFPASSCLSVNQQVVHGIPGGYVLKDGDILGIDVGLWYNDVCVDSAITVGIGNIDPSHQKLLTVTKEALQAGVKAAKPYRRVGAISHAVQEVAVHNNYGIVRALTGHGTGHQVHEGPEIPNYGHPSDGIILKPGMVLAIEPMFTLGKGEVLTQIDGWGIVTADDSISAHFEYTVIITAKGAEVVTRPLA